MKTKCVIMAVCATALMMSSMVSANVIISYGSSLGLFTDSGVKIRDYATNLSNPQGVVTDNAGNVYVADWGNGQVKMYNIATGAFVRNVVDNAVYSPTGLAFDPANPGAIIMIASYSSTNSQLGIWATGSTNISGTVNSDLGAPYGSAYYFPGIAARGWAAGIYVASAGSVFQKYDPTTLVAIGGDLTVGGAGAITGTAADLFLTGNATAVGGYIQRVSDSALIASGLTGAPTGITNDGTNVWAALYGNGMVAQYNASTGAVMNYFTTTAAPVSIAYTTIPEPATLAILGLGGLAMSQRRKRK